MHEKIYLFKLWVIVHVEVSPVSSHSAYENVHKTTSKWNIVIFVFKLRTRGVGKDLKGSGDGLVQFIHFIQKYKTSDFQGLNDGYSAKPS